MNLKECLKEDHRADDVNRVAYKKDCGRSMRKKVIQACKGDDNGECNSFEEGRI